MSSSSKTPGDSHCIMSEIVLPNDTNSLGNLMGGRLLHWMDICAAISAQRHAGCTCVTVGVDEVDFTSAIRLGEIVILTSQVNRTFRTSMEIEINVWAENPQEETKRKCNQAFFTFVAIGPDRSPRPVPSLTIETKEEQTRSDEAGRRREFRLLHSGRIGPEHAPNLAAYLNAFKTK